MKTTVVLPIHSLIEIIAEGARKKQSLLWVLAPQVVKLEIFKNVFSVESERTI